MSSTAIIYQSFRESNGIDTTSRFALITCSLFTNQYHWLRMKPADLGDNIGVGWRTAYRLMTWMEEIGFLMPVEIYYERKQVKYVYISGFPITAKMVEAALTNIRDHFTVSDKKHKMTLTPAVAVPGVDIPGRPVIPPTSIPGERTITAIKNGAQVTVQKIVTGDKNEQNLSPMTRNRKQKIVTHDKTGQNLSPMTKAPEMQFDGEEGQPAAPVAPMRPPDMGMDAGSMHTMSTGDGTELEHLNENSNPPNRQNLTSADGGATLGTGKKGGASKRDHFSNTDLTSNTISAGGGNSVGKKGAKQLAPKQGSSVIGEEGGKTAKKKSVPLPQLPLIPGMATDNPTETLVDRWFRIIKYSRPPRPQLIEDYIQPATQLLELTDQNVDEAIRLLNAKRAEFIHKGFKNVRKLSTLAGHIIAEREVEKLAALPADEYVPVPTGITAY